MGDTSTFGIISILVERTVAGALPGYILCKPALITEITASTVSFISIVIKIIVTVAPLNASLRYIISEVSSWTNS
jgi:hypothetical protein